MAVILLEVRLVNFQTALGAERIANAYLLVKAEQSAEQQKGKLKIWKIMSRVKGYTF